MNDINFIAIDFETATGKRASICEAGIYHTTRITVQADDAEMCAQLFLREIKSAGWVALEETVYCKGKL
ncbi:hypothetical protein [uncultured Prevotella sp.]|uniref:hypothetical protein n=1 Tax=uncultured Prevotella sp. TaxID=159272 RepID=UPI0025859AD3|nr:hypothetical protein [uncultured Prevotella sp.]